MEKRNRDKTNSRIRGEDRLRLPEVDALEEEAVGDEAGNHRKGGEVPLVGV